MTEREHWIERARGACEHAGFIPVSIEPLVTWDEPHCANAVYRIDGRRYLKLFGPKSGGQFVVERTTLRVLEGHPEVPAPTIVADAVRPGAPPYLLLTEVPGSTAEHIWEHLPHDTRASLAGELGAIARRVRRVPTTELAELERVDGGWERRVDAWAPVRASELERADLADRHRDALLRFVRDEAPLLLQGEFGLTHYDLAHNHIYLSNATGAWRVSGILDWADAVVGPFECDVAYVWNFAFRYRDAAGVDREDREAMAAWLTGAFGGDARPDRFARRCFAALLHTPSMGLLWPWVLEAVRGEPDVVGAATRLLFPEAIFGPPD